jgi:hypothetical protein
MGGCYEIALDWTSLSQALYFTKSYETLFLLQQINPAKVPIRKLFFNISPHISIEPFFSSAFFLHFFLFACLLTQCPAVPWNL